MSAIQHHALMLGQGGTQYAYWNPSDKASPAVLSDGNRVVGGPTTATKWVRSISSKNSGKYRVQFVDEVHPPGSGTTGFGFATSASIGTFLGASATGWGLWGNYSGTALRVYNNNAFVAHTLTLAASDEVDLLIDINAGKAWWRKNGAVISGDPVAGTGQMATFTPGLTLFLCADPFTASMSTRLRTNPSEMTGASVAGFTDGWPI